MARRRHFAAIVSVPTLSPHYTIKDVTSEDNYLFYTNPETKEKIRMEPYDRVKFAYFGDFGAVKYHSQIFNTTTLVKKFESFKRLWGFKKTYQDVEVEKLRHGRYAIVEDPVDILFDLVEKMFSPEKQMEVDHPMFKEENDVEGVF